MIKKIKERIVGLIPSRIYWTLVGKTNPFSAAIEGIKDEKKFYKLGKFELDIFQMLGVLEKGYTVLEIGCGPGRIQKSLCDYDKSLCVFGTDISPTMIAKARRFVPEANFSTNNGKSLRNFKDGSIDLIFSFVVFQHIDESLFKIYLAESMRVLKRNGTIVFQIPSSEEEKNYSRPKKHPWRLRRYKREEVIEYLRKAGFSKIELYDMGCLRNPKTVDHSGFLFKAVKSENDQT